MDEPPFRDKRDIRHHDQGLGRHRADAGRVRQGNRQRGRAVPADRPARRDHRRAPCGTPRSIRPPINASQARPARPRGRSSRSFPWSDRSWPGLRRSPGAAGLATSAAERGLLDQELVPDVTVDLVEANTTIASDAPHLRPGTPRRRPGPNGSSPPARSWLPSRCAARSGTR